MYVAVGFTTARGKTFAMAKGNIKARTLGRSISSTMTVAVA
jgi:hypothetical protein